MARRTDIEDSVLERCLRPARKDVLFVLEDELDVDEKTSGGVFIVSRVKKNTQARFATVVSVGDDIVDLHVGDRVIFNRAYGNRIPYEWDQVCRLLYLSVDQLEAVIEDESLVDVVVDAGKGVRVF